MARFRKWEGGIAFGMLMRIAGVMFVVFCVYSIVSTQSAIAEKELELAKIEEDIAIMKMENEELQDIIDSDDIGRYMEQLAVENSITSYAYPDERRYYDTSRD